MENVQNFGTNITPQFIEFISDLYWSHFRNVSCMNNVMNDNSLITTHHGVSHNKMGPKKQQ